VKNLSDSIKVRYLDNEEIDIFDPEHLSFFNINTQIDLDRARMLAEQKITDRTVMATSMRKAKT
jgi:molybdopterin-guanine dinucleotide biosynthesis protein A